MVNSSICTGTAENPVSFAPIDDFTVSVDLPESCGCALRALPAADDSQEDASGIQMIMCSLQKRIEDLFSHPYWRIGHNSVKHRADVLKTVGFHHFHRAPVADSVFRRQFQCPRIHVTGRHGVVGKCALEHNAHHPVAAAKIQDAPAESLPDCRFQQQFGAVINTVLALKENVIIGRKIPVGTGVAPLSDFEVPDSKVPTEEDLENL